MDQWLETRESAEAVVLLVRLRRRPQYTNRTYCCIDIGHHVRIEARLQAPVGDRVVLSVGGVPVNVTVSVRCLRAAMHEVMLEPPGPDEC